MRGKYKRYTDAEKAAALAMLDANGGNMLLTAKETRISRTTLQEWRDGRISHDVPDIRQEKRQSLAELFLDEIYAAVGLMPDKRADASYKELATVVGILTDKRQLLLGAATERVEQTITIEALASIDYRHVLSSLEPAHDAIDDGGEDLT